MPHIKLNKGLRRIEVAELQIENDLAFEYFDGLPANQRDTALVKALYIGVLALKQDRLAAFMARTTNELGTELETLKMMYEMKAELFAKSTVKGVAAEYDIADFLTEHVKAQGHSDQVELTGNSAGELPKNKTGDIVCSLGEQGDKRIAIECKFDKNVRLGELPDQDWYGNKFDTALSQLVESKANRDSDQAIIVFDTSSVAPALLKANGSVSYRPAYGFIVIVDSLRGDFENLGVAYCLARDLALANPTVELDTDILMMLIERIVVDASRVADVRSLVEDGIKKSQEIIGRLEQGRLSLEFCRSYLSKFLENGTLSKPDLLEFYRGEGTKDKYRAIQQEIVSLTE